MRQVEGFGAAKQPEEDLLWEVVAGYAVCHPHLSFSFCQVSSVEPQQPEIHTMGHPDNTSR